MNTTYEELVELINNKQLIKYTSYTFQYSYADNGLNTSGNHPFNLTVKAIGNDTLSITAVASQISGTQYFNNSDLSKWIIYYTVNKYDWVGSGSTGTIYFLKDEWDNTAQFDFKNIKVNGEYLLQDINGNDMSVSQLSLCRDNRLTGANASTLTALNNIHLKQLEAGNEVKYNNIYSTNQNIIISGEFNTIYEDCSNITLIGDHNTVKNINNQIDINGNGNTIDSNNDTITIVGDDNNIKDSNNVDIVGNGNSTDSSTDTIINGDDNVVNGSTNTDVTGNDNYVNDSNDTVINGGGNDVDNSNNTNLGGDNNTIGDSDGTTITNGDNNIVNGSTNTDITDSNDTTITDSDGVNGTIPDGGSVDDGILTDPSTGDKTDITDPDNPVISDEPIKDAPADGIIYGRQDNDWTPVPIQEDAPVDNTAYVRQDNDWKSLEWGQIGGTLSNQTDLNDALNSKVDKLFLSYYRGTFNTWADVPTDESNYAHKENALDVDVVSPNDYIFVLDASGYGSDYSGTWLFLFVSTSAFASTSDKNLWKPQFKIPAEQEGTNISIVNNVISALGYIYRPNVNGFEIGYDTRARGSNSFASGQSTSANGKSSATFGYDNIANGNNSIAAGDSNTSDGLSSFTLGKGLVTNYNFQTAVGIFNSNNSSSLFEVGNGNSDTDRKNALRVNGDGNVIIGKTLYSYGMFPYNNTIKVTTTGWRRILFNINAFSSGRFTIVKRYSYFRPEVYIFEYTVGYPNDVEDFSIRQISGKYYNENNRFIDQIRFGRVNSSSTECCIDIHIFKEPYNGIANNGETFNIYYEIGKYNPVPLSDTEPTDPVTYVTINTVNMDNNYMVTSKTNGSTVPYNITTITNSNFTNLTSKDNNTLYFIV